MPSLPLTATTRPLPRRACRQVPRSHRSSPTRPTIGSSSTVAAVVAAAVCRSPRGGTAAVTAVASNTSAGSSNPLNTIGSRASIRTRSGARSAALKVRVDSSTWPAPAAEHSRAARLRATPR